jgi:hypothetical protein
MLPNYLYPFSATVGGRRVRGRLAYEHTVLRSEKRYGKGHLGVFINCYRSFFHIIGSVLAVFAFTFLMREFFGVERALYLTLGAMAALITYQEFYYHPRVYGQIFRKSVVDWLSWMVPAAFCVLFFNL